MYRAKIGAVMDVRGIGIAGEDIGDKSKQCFSEPVTVDEQKIKIVHAVANDQ